MIIKNKLISFLYNHIYNKIFPDYYTELERVVYRWNQCKTLLDVGCGSWSPIRHFKHKINSTWVDTFLPSIERSKNQKIHNNYKQIDVMDIGNAFEPNSFDCVLASDLIEHLEKDDWNKLLEMMEKIAKNKVIVFTPNWFVPQWEYDSNPRQIHKSWRAVKEMKQKWYQIIWINWLKKLKWEYAMPIYKPRFLWKIISDITQYFVRNNPEKAFAILCVKEKN